MKILTVIVITLLMLVVITLANAQSNFTIDSLNRVLETNISEIKRIDTYNAIAYEYRNQDSTKTAFFVDKAIQLSNKINYSEGVSDAYYRIGWATMNKGNYSKAIDLFNKSLITAQKSSYKKGEAVAFNGLGVVYFYKGDYPSALAQYFKSLNIKEKLGIKKSVASSYNNIGLVYHYQGNYPAGLEYHLKSLKIMEELGDKVGMSDSYSNIGKVYEKQGDYPSTLVQYYKSLRLREELKDKKGMANSYRSIGKVYKELGNNISALEYHLKSLKIMEEIGDKYGIATVYNFIGEVYLKQKEYGKALQYQNLSLKLYNEIGAEAYATLPLLDLGEIYLVQKKYTQAIRYLEETIQTAKKLGRNDVVQDGAKLLALAYEGAGNYQEAYKSLKLFKTIADSLNNEETAKKITSQAMQYEFNKKEAASKTIQERKDLEQQQLLQTQKYYTYASIGGLIALLVIALVVYRGKIKQKQANTILEIQKEEIRSQAEELQMVNEKLLELDSFKQGMMGMIVHDLKNPLNFILNASGNADTKLELMQQAGRQMLNMVMNILDVQKFEDAKMSLKLREESAYTIGQSAVDGTYFLAKQKNIKIENRIDKNLSVKTEPEILERVFTNILTNAIKYTPIGGNVILTSKIEHRKATISISDTGSGIPKNQQAKVFEMFGQVQAKKLGNVRSTGLGMAFCKIAIEAHGGEIGLESEVGKGTTFWFILEEGKALVNTSYVKEQKEDINWQLNENEKATLLPYLDALKELEVFVYSDIQDILNKVSWDTPNLQKWRKELETLVFSMDSEAYHDFLNEVG